MKDPSHPIWSLLRLVILMVALTLLLWFNASDFDSTEIRTIAGMFLMAASSEGLTQFVRGLKK